ncbi:MAG TPA: DUF4199 domain-containing protein [Flavobacterium sp.]|jgi:hypothetical protein
MDNITTISPAKAAMQYGILFGVIMVLEFMVGYVMDIDPITTPAYGTIINVLNYLILPATLITISCNNFKKHNSGYISFGQCLKIGVIICVIAGLIYAVFSVIFNLIFPEFMDEILQKTREVMMEQNPDMTEEQMEMGLSIAEKFKNPLIVVPVTIVTFAFIGLIYSLIIGAIVKKDPPQSL